MEFVDTFCPLGKEKCRFCSDEVQREVVRFSVIRDCDLGKVGQTGSKVRRIELGEFCNNDGRHFVRELKMCPKKEALATPLNTELYWMKRKTRGVT